MRDRVHTFAPAQTDVKTYKGHTAAIVTAANEAFAGVLLDLCDSLGRWRRYLHVIDIGLEPGTRAALARRGIGIVDIPETFFAKANLDRDYFRAMYLRPSLPDFVPADIIMWIDADCWVQLRSVVPTYLDSAVAHRDKFTICTMLDVDYQRCIDDYWNYLEVYREQFAMMFGADEAKRLFGNAIFSAGVFAALRTSPVWLGYRELVSELYESDRVAADLAHGHIAEQNSLNLALHRSRLYHILNSEMNWHCHCSDVAREDGYVRIRPSGRIPAIVHLSDMRGPGVVERYRDLGLFYDRTPGWKRRLASKRARSRTA